VQSTATLRRIGLKSRFHGPFQGSVYKLRTREQPLMRVISFIAVLEDGEFPLAQIAGVLQAANGTRLTVIPAIQIQVKPAVAGYIIAIRVLDLGLVETLNDLINLLPDILW
jgi:multidrug resistance efflux pump